MKGKLLFVLLLPLGMVVTAQFQIFGNFQSSGNQWVHFWYMNDSLQKHRDSAYAINGRFVFKGKTGEPTMGYINTDDGKIDALFFFEPGTTRISGDTAFRDYLMVLGGKSTTEYSSYLAMKMPFMEQSYSMSKRILDARAKGDTATQQALWKIAELNWQESRNAELQWMAQHNNSVVTAYLLYEHFLDTYNNGRGIGDSLQLLLGEDGLRSKYIRKRNEIRQHQMRTSVGKPMVHFSQADTSGKSISTKDFAGNYLLIDFWASWCKPCRAENPHVVKAYNKYHSKGFEVLGVSFDKSREKWIEAIIKDTLGWKHVSDLKSWDNEVRELYFVRSIPENYLIDKTGTIIAKSLRGEALNAKLEEIFGE